MAFSPLRSIWHFQRGRTNAVHLPNTHKHTHKKKNIASSILQDYHIGRLAISQPNIQHLKLCYFLLWN